MRPSARAVVGAVVLALAACAPTPLTPVPSASPTALSRLTAISPTATAPPTPTFPPVTITARPTATQPPADTLPLFQQAITADAERYEFAIEKGARFAATPDGRSFYLLWYPAGVGPANPPPMIVTLHGHASWAFDEFYLWQPFAAERGYGIMALQWWFGGGEASADYYQPQDLYRIFSAVLAEQNIPAGTVLLHGFSRGAANTYAVTALDRQAGNNYFALTIANAGGAAEDFPANVEISSGRYGPRPFAETHWVLYCGEQDPNPSRDGCPAMDRTRNWIIRFGGTVDLLLVDSRAGHGGFHQSDRNVNRALDVFAGLAPE